MPRPRRNDSIATKVSLYVDPAVIAEIREAHPDTPLGRILEGLWRASPLGSTSPCRSGEVKPAPPPKPVKTSHRAVVKNWGTLCEQCGAVKGSLRWSLACGSADGGVASDT